MIDMEILNLQLRSMSLLTIDITKIIKKVEKYWPQPTPFLLYKSGYLERMPLNIYSLTPGFNQGL